MTTKDNKTIISLKNVSFWYPDGTHALKNINLEVNQGDFLIILGKNGAGKTTLCLTIVGIIPNIFPGRLEGQVNVMGMVPKEHYVYEITKNVGIVLQDPDSQIFTHSVYSEVTFAAENLALPREEILERAKWALKVVALDGFENRMPRYLSGGQKQRVAIAAALVTKPRILVLDEPTSQLDPVGTREVLDTLRKLNRDENLTIVMTEHKTDEVAELGNKIIIMDDGRILKQGKPWEVFQDIPMLRHLKLKPPEITEFFWRLREKGTEIKTLPLTLDEGVSFITELINKKILIISSKKWQDIEYKVANEDRNILLEVKNVSFEYSSTLPVRALEDVNLTVSEGEFVAIVGKNGSGKTTLMKCICGLLKPTKGEILFRGTNILKFSVRERPRKVSLVLQNPDEQLFLSSASEEVEFGLKNLGYSEEERRRIVNEALNAIGLERFKETHPFQLSFGDRKKLAVASVLALNPDIVVLDEPTTGQDYKGRLEICDLALQLNRRGKTILMVTHDMDLVARYAKRMVVMNDGRVIFDGPVRDGFTRLDLLKAAGLLPPKITLLAQRLERYGVPRDILSVDEMISVFMMGGSQNAHTSLRAR